MLIDFDGDETRADLIQVAITDLAQFAHAAQRAHDEKARAKVAEDPEADPVGHGYAILENDPGYYDTQYSRTSELLTADNQRVTVEDVANVGGRAAHVRAYANGSANISYFVRDAKTAGFHCYSSNQRKSGPMSDQEKAERRT